MSLNPTPRIDRNDYGIIFYGSVNNYAGTYVDYLGQTRQIQRLTLDTLQMMSADIESAYPAVGSATAFDLQMEVLMSGGSMDVGLVGKFGDANTLALTGDYPDFTQIVTEINTTGIGAAVHTIAASGKYMLQTSNLTGVTVGAIQVTGSFGDITNFDIVVRLRVQS